jgi:predicted ATP-binding protein involved in virulence
MDVEINYCNNIDNACITLSENKLNIKFAPNGTGKSTISRAIFAQMFLVMPLVLTVCYLLSFEQRIQTNFSPV